MENKIRFGLIGIGAQGGSYAGILTGKGMGFPGMPAPEIPPPLRSGRPVRHRPREGEDVQGEVS